jgi:SAM-dependent methyltransferase
MKWLPYAERAWRLIEWQALRLGFRACPLCGFHLQARLGNSEHAIRCLRCRASPVTMSLAEVLRQRVPDLSALTVYELSSRGPLFNFLRERAGELVCSEYFDDVPPGGTKDGILCQDIQKLTFSDQVFDLCTSTDVFEHVPDDSKAFAEMRRVLRPGSLAVFTVPMQVPGPTIERAVQVGDDIDHLLPGEYHDDHIRGGGKVLCFRNYGPDIVNRLMEQGFGHAEIVWPDFSRWWGYGRPVVVARRAL